MPTVPTLVPPTVLLSRIDVVYARIPLSGLLPDGGPAVIRGVEVAVLPPYVKSPTAGTAWSPTAWDGQVAVVLLACPDAPETPGAVRVAGSGYVVWVRVVDVPEVAAVPVGLVTLRG